MLLLSWGNTYISISIYSRILGSNLRFQKPEKLLEGGEVHFRPTCGSTSCYRLMVNYPGIISRQNASLVSQARQHNSQYCWMVPRLYFLCSYLYVVVVSYLVHDLMISSLVPGMHTSSLRLNNECWYPETRAGLATFFGWNPVCTTFHTSEFGHTILFRIPDTTHTFIQHKKYNTESLAPPPLLKKELFIYSNFSVFCML